MDETNRIFSVDGHPPLLNVNNDEFENFYCRATHERPENCPGSSSTANHAMPTGEHVDGGGATCSKLDPAILLNTVQALLQQNTQMLDMLRNAQPPPVAVRNPQAEVAAINMVPEIIKSIPQFNGEGGPIEAREWLQQLETSAIIHNWPESVTFQMAVSNLVGAANHWMRGRFSNVRSWQQFKAAFRKSFMYETSKTDLWRKMQSRVQQPRESAASYFFEKSHLCNELGFSFHEVKEQILIGLWSRELSNFLISKEHVDEDELFQDVVVFEKVDSARRKHIKDKREAGSKPNDVRRFEVKKEEKCQWLVEVM